MRRFFLLTLLIVLALPRWTAQAQAAPTLAELEIEFWPEYDKAAILVIYHGTLAADAALPAPITLRYAAQFGEPLAVAYTDAQGSLLNLEYTTSTEGDDLVIHLAVPTREFRVEYYDTTLDLSAATRRFAFNSAAEFDIQSLVLKVQRPPTATDLNTTPALPEAQTGTDGLQYIGLTRANIAAGTAITLDLSYTKTTNALTVSSANTVPAQVDTPATAAPKVDALLIGIIVAGVAGLVFIGWGVWGYFRPADGLSRTARPNRARKHGGKASADAPTGEAVFCHKCGTRAQPDDEFCRNCGTRLRREE